jgi:type II restriction enzyme
VTDRSENALHAAIAKLTQNQMSILTGVAQALAVPVTVIPSDKSDLVDEVFAETMGNLLTLHHALHEEALSKRPFEYVLKQCLLAQGLDAYLNPTPGESSYDVAASGVRWSLKTEAAKGISPRQVKIEKFMEARWARECLTPEACFEALERIVNHMDGYDRILVLRAFIRRPDVVYRLEEVPKDRVLEALQSARPSMFGKRGRAKSYGADFPVSHSLSKPRMFRLLLDSSVEKVRLWYDVKHCVHHGEWRIPVGELSAGSGVHEGQLDLIGHDV